MSCWRPAVASALSLLTWRLPIPASHMRPAAPSRNVLGPVGAIISDLVMQLLGLAGVFVFLPPVFWALQLIGKGRLDSARIKLMLAPAAVLLLACAASSLPRIAGWPLPYSFGGAAGRFAAAGRHEHAGDDQAGARLGRSRLFCFAGGMMLLMTSLGLSQRDLKLICQRPRGINSRSRCPRLASAGRNVRACDGHPARADAAHVGAAILRHAGGRFVPYPPNHAGDARDPHSVTGPRPARPRPATMTSIRRN